MRQDIRLADGNGADYIQVETIQTPSGKWIGLHSDCFDYEGGEVVWAEVYDNEQAAFDTALAYARIRAAVAEQAYQRKREADLREELGNWVELPGGNYQRIYATGVTALVHHTGKGNANGLIIDASGQAIANSVFFIGLQGAPLLDWLGAANNAAAQAAPILPNHTRGGALTACMRCGASPAETALVTASVGNWCIDEGACKRREAAAAT